MEIKLHANATTTPRIRRYLQQSDKTDKELSLELGISVTTVRRWRQRKGVADKSTIPNAVHKSLRHEQVVLVNALRELLQTSLDELLVMVNAGLGITLSRATLNRYLSQLKKEKRSALPRGRKAIRQGLRPYNMVVHHVLLSLHIDDGGEHHLLWAREPVSGWCFARIYSGMSPTLLGRWFDTLLNAYPCNIQSVETLLDFQPENFLSERGIVLKITREEERTVRLVSPLVNIIPALSTQSLSEFVINMCDLYNNGIIQKKLDNATPVNFLQSWKK